MLVVTYFLILLAYIIILDRRISQDYHHIENAPMHSEIFKTFAAVINNRIVKINPNLHCNLYLFFNTNSAFPVHYWNHVLKYPSFQHNIHSCIASLSHYNYIHNQSPDYPLYHFVSLNAALTFSDLNHKKELLINNGKWNHPIFLKVNSNPTQMAINIQRSEP